MTLFEIPLILIQLSISYVLVYYAIKIFKLAEGYSTQYGRFTFQLLTIGVCINLKSSIELFNIIHPPLFEVLNSFEIIILVIMGTAFMTAGFELRNFKARGQPKDAPHIIHETPFQGHVKGAVPRNITNISMVT